jgi:hypothetical protein
VTEKLMLRRSFKIEKIGINPLRCVVSTTQWLESYLCPFINHRQSDWVDWLPLAEFTHNNTKSKATGKPPFEIVYGRSPMISPELEPTRSPAADDRAKQLSDTIQEVQVSIQWAQESYKQAGKAKPPTEFAPGDKV